MSQRRFIPLAFAVLALVAGGMAARLGRAANGALPEDKYANWAADMAAFEKQDAEHPFAPGGIVFVGSSSVRLWDLPKWFPRLPVLNRGFGGSQVDDSVHFVDLLAIKHKPRIVVFYAGDNDVAEGKSAEAVHGDFRRFVAAVRASLPETKVIFISIKPSILRWERRETQQAANRLIAADCEKDPKLEFLDVWPAMLGADGKPRKEIFREDGLHMNDAGYKIWVELLSPLLAAEGGNGHEDTKARR